MKDFSIDPMRGYNNVSSYNTLTVSFNSTPQVKNTIGFKIQNESTGCIIEITSTSLVMRKVGNYVSLNSFFEEISFFTDKLFKTKGELEVLNFSLTKANRFNFEKDVKMTDYLKFVPEIEEKEFSFYEKGSVNVNFTKILDQVKYIVKIDQKSIESCIVDLVISSNRIGAKQTLKSYFPLKESMLNSSTEINNIFQEMLTDKALKDIQ